MKDEANVEVQTCADIKVQVVCDRCGQHFDIDKVSMDNEHGSVIITVFPDHPCYED